MSFGARMKLLGTAFSLGLLAANAIASTAEGLLSPYPSLLALYQAYPAQRATFADYANRQGFREPVEHVATLVHELVHYASAAHQGYFVDGVYYEPYLRADAWPSITNAQVAPALRPQEEGVVSRVYMQNAPTNTLANVVDEINAYGHVLKLVCQKEPGSAPKQITNLMGFLHLQEAYLRTARVNVPAEYRKVTANKQTRGAMTLITRRAWKALQECGVPAATIPTAEMTGLLGK